MTDAPCEAVLFDLDGTLADTAPDMSAALNALLAEQQRPALPFALARPLISHGSAALVRAGFGEAAEGEGLTALRQRFLDLYGDSLCVRTRLFDGVEAMLDGLEARGLRWGVVTNKPSFLAEPLLQALHLSQRSACIVSGNTTARAKPDPLPLQHACELLAVQPQAAIYVGDAENDAIAAQGAAMPSLIALYGYIGDNENPRSWQADGYLNSPAELLPWLQRHRA